mgnify:CR=1 FL=1
MSEILYYTIEYEKELFDNDMYMLTGIKTITVYEILDNIPKLFCSIESYLERSSEEEIQYWLDNNNYEDMDYSFELL